MSAPAILVSALCALAQTPPPQQPAALAPAAPGTSAPPPPAGLLTPWEIAPVLQEIAAHAARLLPALDKLDAKAWVAKGASETYAEQLQSSRDQARALADGARELARNPERLSTSLELFFRMQGLDAMLGSLQEGLRKYQGPAEAQQLAELAAENGVNRDRFQGYIINLAAEREQEMQVMDREAQRCRGIIAAPAAPPRVPGRKK
jgi:hypothetical protein